jgi:hypothetical protein
MVQSPPSVLSLDHEAHYLQITSAMLPHIVYSVIRAIRLSGIVLVLPRKLYLPTLILLDSLSTVALTHYASVLHAGH